MIYDLRVRFLFYFSRVCNALFGSARDNASLTNFARTHKGTPLKLLVIHPQGIGDTVVFTPTLDALANHFSHLHIEVVTTQAGAKILENNSAVAQVHIVKQHLGASLGDYFSLLSSVRKKEFDFVIDTSITYTHLLTLLFSWLAAGKKRIAFSRGGYVPFLATHTLAWKHAHMVEIYGQIAACFGLDVTMPRISLTSQEKQWAKAFIKDAQTHVAKKNKKPIIFLHPSCQSAWRMWDPKRFVNIIDWLVGEYGALVFVSTTSKESFVLDAIQKETNSAFVPLVDYDLRKIIALTSASDLVVSIDTGIVHVATALNIPTVCIYGPTSQDFWRPYGANQVVLQDKTCKDISNTIDLSSPIIRQDSRLASCSRKVGVSDVKLAIKKFLG